MEQNKIALFLLCAVLVVGLVGTMISIVPVNTGADTTSSTTPTRTYQIIDLEPRIQRGIGGYTSPYTPYRTDVTRSYQYYDPIARTYSDTKPSYQYYDPQTRSYKYSNIPPPGLKALMAEKARLGAEQRKADATAKCKSGEIILIRSDLQAQIRSHEGGRMYGRVRISCRISDPGPSSGYVCCNEYIGGGGPFIWKNGKSYNKASAP